MKRSKLRRKTVEPGYMKALMSSVPVMKVKGSPKMTVVQSNQSLTKASKGMESSTKLVSWKRNDMEGLYTVSEGTERGE